MLVVDDDAGVRDVCSTLLRALGYDAAVASNGDHALDAVSARAPQLVLLDLELPGMRGEDVLRAVKAHSPEVRVVVMSGRPGRDLSRAREQGADAVLRKPFKMSELEGALIRA
ncbi:MAG TPA: response regulator [Polyangiales bacterium]|nr:response regulator [Polyangiales bacterium]